MDLNITLAGGKKVNVEFGKQTIYTDQSIEGGGEGSAPEPYALFLASIGACAGVYVLGFCQARNIPTDGIRLTQHLDWDPVKHRLEKISIKIHVPPSFPEKYHQAVAKAADACAVKKTILAPPEFAVQTVVEQ